MKVSNKAVTNGISFHAILTQQEDELGLQSAIRDSWKVIAQEVI